METVTDIPSATRWSTAGLTQSTLLGQSGNSLDYLQYLDVPAWTFSSDRFWILRGTKKISGSHYVFSWTRLGDKGGPYRSAYDAVLAANSSAVEPPLNVGAWEFTQSGSTTTVTYTICTDSGGSVPRSIQNAATKKTLPDTVGDLVRECLIRSK